MPSNAAKDNPKIAVGADQGKSVPRPEPATPAAIAAGTVGTGAVAAAEADGTPQEFSLTDDERRVLQVLIRRFGGVDGMAKWLREHPEI